MSTRRSLLLALLVMLLWGSLYPAVKLGYSAYRIQGTADILLFVGLRFTVCGGIISLWGLLRYRRAFLPTRSTILPILLSGLFAIILHYSLTYSAMLFTDSSKTALLKQIGVLLYVCFSFLFFKEDRLTPQKLIGVVLGLCGVLAINIDGGVLSFGIGEVLVVLASLCTVASNIVSKKVLQRVEPLTVTGVSQLFGGLVLLILGLAMGGRVELALNADLWIFVYICLASIISYCIWFSIVKGRELSGLFIIKFAEPIFACAVGALLLHEDILKPQYLIAFLLISGGICISNLKKKA
ncbi:MAG: DMT family transporter [Clostridia bacterium]|nr:DMT family transporter [Clostridia bacterium]